MKASVSLITLKSRQLDLGNSISTNKLNHQELMGVLDGLEVSRSPSYSGFGIEIYACLEKQIQIIHNHRENKTTINRGF